MLPLQLLLVGRHVARRDGRAASGISGTGQDGDSDDIAWARASIHWALATVEFTWAWEGGQRAGGHGGLDALGRDQAG